jgi:chaperonin GroEL
VEDAINAASCALENGIVPGGGVALLQAAKSLPQEEIGAIILREALKSPFRWIVENAGGDREMLEAHGMSASEGFNSKTGRIVDMFDVGIVDPTDVVLNAVTSAIGVASQILTIGTVVTLPKVEEKPFPMR